MHKDPLYLITFKNISSEEAFDLGRRTPHRYLIPAVWPFKAAVRSMGFLHESRVGK